MAPTKPQEIVKASKTVPEYQGNDSSRGVGAAPELLQERPSEADRRHAQAQPNQASQPPSTSPRAMPADPEGRPGLDFDEGMAEHTTVDDGIERGIGQGEGSISKAGIGKGEGSISKAGNAREKRQDAFPSTIPVKQKLGLSSVGPRLGYQGPTPQTLIPGINTGKSPYKGDLEAE